MFLLVFVYISPEYSTWYNNKACHCGITLLQESLMDVLQHVGDVSILLGGGGGGGDFNARTGVDLDFVKDDILSSLQINNCDYLCDSLNMPRFSCDKTTNSFGKKLLDLCATLNLTIFNGRRGRDTAVGDFTFISHLGTSVIDYIISSNDLFTLCNRFDIKSRSESPHLPLSCSFQSRDTCDSSDTARATHKNEENHKFIWSVDCCQRFRENILSPDIKTILETCTTLAITDINKAIELFTDAIHQAAAFMKKSIRSASSK